MSTAEPGLGPIPTIARFIKPLASLSVPAPTLPATLIDTPRHAEYNRIQNGTKNNDGMRKYCSRFDPGGLFIIYSTAQQMRPI